MKKNNCKNGVCGIKNQTSAHCIPESNDQLGIGFFCYKNSEIERGIEKIKVEDISYKDTLKKGEDSIAFNFIPYGVEIVIDGEKVICKKGMFDEE